jgi:hypothetical protein
MTRYLHQSVMAAVRTTHRDLAEFSCSLDGLQRTERHLVVVGNGNGTILLDDEAVPRMEYSEKSDLCADADPFLDRILHWHTGGCPYSRGTGSQRYGVERNWNSEVWKVSKAMLSVKIVAARMASSDRL